MAWPVAGVAAWYGTSDWELPRNMKKHPHILACILLLLPLALGLSLQEDDLVFDDVGEDNSDNVPDGPVLINHRASRGRSERYEHGSSSRDGRRHASRVERAWGVPDSVVPVGHVFRMKIPRQAFSGSVDFYEVSSAARLILRPRTWNVTGKPSFFTGSALRLPDEKNICPTLLEFQIKLNLESGLPQKDSRDQFWNFKSCRYMYKRKDCL